MKKFLLMLCLCMPLCIQAQKSKKIELNIVYIGNSITQGVLLQNPQEEAPPVRTTLWLKGQEGIAEVHMSNQGVSGMTTVDFLPASKTRFLKVKEAMEALKTQNPKAKMLFSVMLGTNDSANSGPNGSPISAPQYYTNMKVIIDELLEAFPDAVFVLHRPIWYSPTTYNGAQYLASGLKRLETYYPQLQELVSYYGAKHPGQVHLGDTEASAYFEAHYQTDLIPEEGRAGTFYLHPNKKGAESLAEFWGKAIYKVLTEKK